MQSSYSLIKRDRALESEEKKIVTNYRPEDYGKKAPVEMNNSESSTLESYETIGANIIKEAQRKRDQILLESRTQAALIEKNAYEKGYNQGIQNGHEDGRNEAIEATMPKAMEEAEMIIDNAKQILSSAEHSYNDYLKNKKQEIINLSFIIAEKILRREVLKDDGINEMIEEAFQLAKGEENIIVRCNTIYKEELESKIPYWKTTYNITGEIFVLSGDDIEPGNAIVEKNSGMIQVGIDVGLEGIVKAIIG